MFERFSRARSSFTKLLWGFAPPYKYTLYLYVLLTTQLCIKVATMKLPQLIYKSAQSHIINTPKPSSCIQPNLHHKYHQNLIKHPTKSPLPIQPNPHHHLSQIIITNPTMSCLSIQPNHQCQSNQFPITNTTKFSS